MLEELWCREVKIDEQVLDMPPTFETVSFFLSFDFFYVNMKNSVSPRSRHIVTKHCTFHIVPCKKGLTIFFLSLDKLIYFFRYEMPMS